MYVCTILPTFVPKFIHFLPAVGQKRRSGVPLAAGKKNIYGTCAWMLLFLTSGRTILLLVCPSRTGNAFVPMEPTSFMLQSSNKIE